MEYTDMERRILDMWPKYEDGTYVQLWDSYIDTDGDDNQVMAIEFNDRCTDLVGLEGFHTGFDTSGERVKRPAPKVLDADGVEIKVGDTVWHKDGTMLRVDGFGGIEDGETIVNVHVIRGAVPWIAVRSLSLTHVQPDSWERLEDDATMPPWSYRDKYELVVDRSYGESYSTVKAFATDLIRRAKAIAEKEAAR